MDSPTILTSAQQVWDLIATQIKEQLSQASWNTWFTGCRVDAKSVTDDIIILVPSSVAHEKITSAFKSIIDDAIENISDNPITIHFVVETKNREEDSVIDLRAKSKRTRKYAFSGRTDTRPKP